MNVVWTLAPESWITVVGVNPLPVTTIVTADEPTGTSLGVTDAMASGTALPPAPEAVPEFAGAAPHPESRKRRRDKDRTRRKKPKGPARQKFIESADYRNPGWRARKKSFSMIDVVERKKLAFLSAIGWPS
jgi:hypothetical protein